MTRWNTYKLSELGRIVTGRTPPSSQPEMFHGDIPFITPSDVDGLNREIVTERFVSSEWNEQQSRIALPPRSVCVVCIGATIGKVCLTTTACQSNQQMNSILIDKTRFDPLFVYYRVCLLKEELKARAAGAATPIVNKSAFSELTIEAPELSVQRRIASILGAYDDLIEVNRRRIAVLEGMARRLFEEWFVRFRFPGHQAITFIGGLPEGWTQRTLGQVAEVRLGKMLDKEKNRGELRSYLANVNVRWGSFDLDDLREMRFESHEVEKYGLMPGDIVMCEGGEPGRCAIWKNQLPGAMLQKALHRIRAHDQQDQQYLYRYLLFIAKSGRLAGLFTGATIKHLPREKLLAVAVVVPAKRLIQEFADHVAPMEALIGIFEAANRRAFEARDLLLPRLISGDLSVAAAERDLEDAA